MQAGNAGRDTTGIPTKTHNHHMTADDLRKHIMWTYHNLRMGMVCLAIVLPVILWVIGYVWHGLPLQGSMSAYYHSPMRDIFVGALWAIGVFLWLYKGFSTGENILLNIAGAAAILVALFPMEWACGTACRPITLHGIFAMLFFFSIACVCWFRAQDTLHLVTDPHAQQRYRQAYKVVGLLLGGVPIIVYVLAVLFQFRETENRTVFVLEAVGIWIFGTYWIIKSVEIRQTHAEDRTLDRNVYMTDAGVRATDA